jgi:hypothetical protein
MSINSLHKFIFRYYFAQKQKEKASIRDEKGRFVKGNKFRFRHDNINLEGKYTVLAQPQQIGKFFKAIKVK